MSSYPSQVTIQDSTYHFERILKDDFFSLNILYRHASGKGQVLKLSDFRFVGGWLLRPLAAFISRREYTMYRRVRDIPGVPTLGPRFERRGYFHEFIEGKTLWEYPNGRELPLDFFDQLSRILTEVHRRRIFYADLNKRGNIICSSSGKVYLIDFQICLYFPPRSGWIGARLDRLLRSLQREDRYHILKHKKKLRPDLLREEERAGTKRSLLNQVYGKCIWRPYVTVKRLIYPQGSNETIWYKWRRQQDQSPKMP